MLVAIEQTDAALANHVHADAELSETNTVLVDDHTKVTRDKDAICLIVH